MLYNPGCGGQHPVYPVHPTTRPPESQPVGQVEGAEQHVLAQSGEPTAGFPGVGEQVVLQGEDASALLRPGVPAHDVDAVVVERARQVQARPEGVLR